MTKGWTHPALRDELYLQLVKQTTENPWHGSLMLGWDLMTIGLSFFPPSHRMFPFLTEYIFRHLDATCERQTAAVVDGGHSEQSRDR
jgi:hypothetical protein